MKRPPVISVIIPTHNRLAFLRETIASVLAQSYKEWELVVVDDCSEDGTWHWLCSLDDDRIRPLHLQRNRMYAEARNEGLRAAHGDCVLFLDDDDWLFPQALTLLLEALRSTPSAVAAVGARVQGGADGWRRAPHPHRLLIRHTLTDVMGGWVPQCSQVLLQRSAAMQAGCWRHEFLPAEDDDFWLRVARLGAFALIPETVSGYRIHRGQSLRAGASTRALAARRGLLAGLEGMERSRGEGANRARRLARIARRAYREAALGKAAAFAWRAIACAPSALWSPLTRSLILPLALRCSAGAILGRRGVLFWRHWRRALTLRIRIKPTPAVTPGRQGVNKYGGQSR